MDWQWSSLYRRQRNNWEDQKLLTKLLTELLANYLESVNLLLREDTLKTVRHSITKGTPFGSEAWTEEMVGKYNLDSTLREPGRPKSI